MKTEQQNSYIEQLEARIKKLEEENSILNQIIYKAPIPVFVLDKDHSITHFNQAMEELSGFHEKEMTGTNKQWRAFYSSQRPVMADLIIDRSSDSEIIEYYGRKYDLSGKEKDRFAGTDFFKDIGEDGKWLYFTASTFNDSSGQIAGAVETIQDVSEEKAASHKTEEFNQLYLQIMEFVPYPIVVYDEKGHVIYTNPAFSDTFGWELKELEGKTLPFVPEHLQKEIQQIVNKLRENKTLTRHVTQRLTKDDRILDVVLWAASYSDVNTGSSRNFVILRNITEEKRLEANNKTIMRIGALLPEYPELEGLMSYISREVKTLLNTEGAVVLLYDEVRDEVFFTGGSYDDSEKEKRAKTIRCKADSLLAGKIIRTGEYALVNDAQGLAKKYPDRDNILGYKTKNILEVPIKSEDRIIGVLCAINKKQNPFDYHDMELMTMIAGTCALSIENARFSEAVKEAYHDMASMNRAKGKAINHLSHELKTPVAVLMGSLQILRKKLEAFPQIKVRATIDRIERNLNRISDIQNEVADIMDDKTYSAQTLLLRMLEVCQDELETLIQRNLEEDMLEESIRKLIDEKFGPRTIEFKSIEFKEFFRTLWQSLQAQFKFRDINISLNIDNELPILNLPIEIIDKMISGIIKNAIENTPDKSGINISINKKDSGILFSVHDFGIGIEDDAKERIFEGFFNPQDPLLYSTKTPFSFNAGGKGADLLRIKMFAARHGFTLNMDSQRCSFLIDNEPAECPGNIDSCQYCNSLDDCRNSGFSIFTIFFHSEK